MRKLILGVTLVPALASPVLACQVEYDPIIGVYMNCDYVGFNHSMPSGAGSAAAPAPCTGAGLAHGTQACNNPQAPIWDGGGPVNGSDTMGFGAAATAFGIAVMSGNPAAIGAAGMALGAASAGPVGDAASSGAVGDAAAASAAEGGGF